MLIFTKSHFDLCSVIIKTNILLRLSIDREKIITDKGAHDLAQGLQQGRFLENIILAFSR